MMIEWGLANGQPFLLLYFCAMKTCSSCVVNKDQNSFCVNNRTKDGLHPVCKECQKSWREENKEKLTEKSKEYAVRKKEEIREYKRQYYLKNKDSMSAQKKVYHEKNKEKLNEKARQYYKDNKNIQAQKAKIYRESNKELIAERKKQYAKDNKDLLKASKRSYYEKNREHMLAQNKEYYIQNRDVKLEYARNYGKINRGARSEYDRLYILKRKNEDPIFRLKANLRGRLNRYCKYSKLNKRFKTMDSLGISPSEFKVYIEDMFVDGMSWDNYGSGNNKWSIDHIKPLCTATTEEEVFILNHHTNLRPMWWFDNLSKGGKYQEL